MDVKNFINEQNRYEIILGREMNWIFLKEQSKGAGVDFIYAEYGYGDIECCWNRASSIESV